MQSIPGVVKAGLNGAVGGAALAVLFGLLLALSAGGYVVAVPGHLEATGGTANGAASVEFTIKWSVLSLAAVAGVLFEVRWARLRA